MNILPGNYTEFKDKEYWNHFFKSLKNTKNEFFEWYGCYQDYKAILKSLVQPDQSIFHVGCGKSTFSEEILKDNRELNLDIVNCDYSENVINEMIQRTKQEKIKMEYIVCDLLEPLEEKHNSRYHLVLDKGALDAMLPENSVENILKIKEAYFANMTKCLKKNGKFVIISLLQPFVLKTIIEYFGFQPEKYEVHVYECLIKNSKMQPFLIEITVEIEANAEKFIKYHPLNAEETQNWTSVEEALSKVSELQEQIAYGERIRELFGGRRTKFNIYDQNNGQSLRFILEVSDSEEKEILKQNTCSVFIVPQGKENSYLFNDDQGIKTLLAQIKSSRVILAKMITGNKFENLEKVKTELNSVIPNFVQKNSPINKVSYLTDADELGQRSYLYENEEFIIDEVLVEGQPIRRFFLRKNPLSPQCEFKLTYFSELHNKNLKEINSKILPSKKGLVIGIDKQELFDNNSQYIFSGLTYFYSHPREGWKMLIIGNQFSLAKYLCENYENVDIIVVCGKYKTVESVVRKYLELENCHRITIVAENIETYLQNNNDSFDIIIHCENESSSSENPNISHTFDNFQTQLQQHLSTPGIYALQYSNYSHTPRLEQFFPIYACQANYTKENILFALLHEKKYKGPLINVHANLVEYKPKNKPEFEWQGENFKEIIMVYPDVKIEEKEFVFDKEEVYIEIEEKFENIYNIADSDKGIKKADKKKKKKK